MTNPEQGEFEKLVYDLANQYGITGPTEVLSAHNTAVAREVVAVLEGLKDNFGTDDPSVRNEPWLTKEIGLELDQAITTWKDKARHE